MYECLLERLINKSQIYKNLRRTAREGLISKIDRIQLSKLALKYFGVDENGNYTNDKEQIVAYKCPYSGKITKDPNTLALDHIIPFTSGGGTVLFNCIPVDAKSNLSKNASSLMNWWTKQEFFSIDRLQRLLDYMFEAYALTFKEYTIEELENSYKESIEDIPEEYTFDSDEELTEENDIYRRREEVKKKESLTFDKLSYQQFIINVIGFLKKNGIDCSIYETKLKELEEHNIFKDIERFELIQRTLQNYIINELGDDNRYITYSVCIDINRLLKSFKTDDMVSELRERLVFIQRLLKDNNKTLKQYFENVTDIEEYNILYMNNPSEVNITKFLNSLTLNHETKIDKFIEMLSMEEYTGYKDGYPNDNNIFRARNKVPFKNYEHIDGLNTSMFWVSNNDAIVERIKEKVNELSQKEKITQEEEQELEKLNKAKKAIEDYSFANIFNVDLKIDKFIEMLSMDEYTGYKDGKPDDNSIFRARNKVPFKNYEHIDGLNTSMFWVSNNDVIVERIRDKINVLSIKEKLTQEEKLELDKLNKANKAIDDYRFYNPNNMDLRIDKFIEMLSMDEYTGYKDGKLDDNNIFSYDNKVPFKDYEHIDGLNTAGFWSGNVDRIVQRIQEKIELLLKKETLTIDEKEKLERLNKAKKTIDDYIFYNQYSIDLKIDKFIEMLSMDEYTSYKDGKPDDNNVFCNTKSVSFKDYKDIAGLNTTNFWKHHNDRIIQRINERTDLLNKKDILTKEERGELEKLNKAKKAIVDYNFVNALNVDLKIDKFIEMLAMDEYTGYKNGKPDGNNIFKGDNKVSFKDYRHINGLNTSNFWGSNSDKIVEQIKEKISLLSKKEQLTQEEKQKLEKFNKANKAIDNYNFANPLNVDLRIDKFIEMLSMDEYTGYKNGRPDDNNIFKQNNKVSFKDYEHIDGLNTSSFWNTNGDKIVERIKEKRQLLSSKEKLTIEDVQKLERLTKANKAIDDYNFANPVNLFLRIDKFIEMLGMDEYTNSKNGKLDDYNIFKQSNKVSFKNYEHIKGLNTSYFWIQNSVKNIIPKLFFSNEYSDAKYDKARKNVMIYLNYLRRRSKQPEFNSIREYIETLDKANKEVQDLIKLRDELLFKEKELVLSNNELRNNEMVNMRAV